MISKEIIKHKHNKVEFFMNLLFFRFVCVIIFWSTNNNFGNIAIYINISYTVYICIYLFHNENKANSK